MPTKVKGRIDRSADWPANQFTGMLRDLYALPFNGQPVYYEPDYTGGELFLDYQQRLDDLVESTSNAVVQGIRSKHGGIALRLALIIHILEHVPNPVPRIITSGMMEQSLVLAEWMREENERVLRFVLASHEERDVAGLVALIRDKFNGSVTCRALMRHNNRRFVTVTSTESHLSQLKKADLGDWQDDETGVRRFVLRPTESH